MKHFIYFFYIFLLDPSNYFYTLKFIVLLEFFIGSFCFLFNNYNSVL
jgi:hypothetical protein